MKEVCALLIGLFLSTTVVSQDCPSEYLFTTQAQIDSFQINYPNCTEIEGDVEIGNMFDVSNINNLNGLSVLNSIGGQFTIHFNDSLTSLIGLQNITSVEVLRIVGNIGLTNLTGLEGLSYIEEEFIMYDNPYLTSLTGLENLSSIGFALIIWDSYGLTNLTGLEGLSSIGGNLNIKYNDALINFTGLDNLTFIGTNIVIDDNCALTSLTGLDNVDVSSVTNLEIVNNESLSICYVQSVCDYLADPGYGNIDIENNATGCNSQEDVETACGVGLFENGMSENQIKIYPNPASSFISIELSYTIAAKNSTLTICNVNSQQVLSRSLMKPKTILDIDMLSAGIYFVKVTHDRTVQVGKFVKQ